MNKAIYLCAAAALALASCSNDETVGVAQQSGISFRAVTGVNSRGVETTTNNLAQMYVKAFEAGSTNEYFGGQTDGNLYGLLFSKDGATNTFVSTPEYYWLNGKTLHFIATAPIATDWAANPQISFDGTNFAATFTDVTPATDVADQKDLIIGTASGTANTDASGLDLTLNHVLSQIQVMAKNTSTAYVYTIKGVRIASVAAKGTYTFPAGTWAAGADKQTYDVILDAPVVLDGTDAVAKSVMKAVGAASDNAMLIPQQLTAWAGTTAASGDNFDKGAYISLLLNVKTNAGSYIYPSKANSDADCGWAAVAIDTKWEAGNKYIYTLDLSKGCGKVDPVQPNEDGKDIVKPGTDDSEKGDKIFGEPIKFDVTVTEWTPSAKDMELE